MNWVFWFLLILALILIWFGLTVLFKPTGIILSKIFKDTIDIINEKESEKKEN